MVSVSGQAWAAKKNREQEVRTRIVRTLQELAIPATEWPDFIQSWQVNAPHQQRFGHKVTPPSFQPPVYDRLAQSIEEWKKVADAAWERLRDHFVRQRRYWEQVGVDEKIPPATKTRGPGKTGRYAKIEDRYKWAALRLRGLAWKEIAAQSPADISTVTKAATQVLRAAGWPAKLSAIKAAANTKAT